MSPVEPLAPTTACWSAAPVALLPGLQRLRAPNAGPMTGAGTNCYLLGDPVGAVLDPGPVDERQLAALLRAAPRLRYVFITHTHGDHSPLAPRLAAATGAELIGRPPPQDGRQDLTCSTAREPRDGECFDLGLFTLTAVYTPGHASNHVCYVLNPGSVLLSGDHVLEGVTPVILPPDGDLQDYVTALRRLAGLPLDFIGPGHGGLIAQPRKVIEGVIAHRLRREQKLCLVLQSLRQGRMDDLLPKVYDDVPAAMHGWARLTLEAHLIKLQRDGAVRRDGDLWLYAAATS
jgi:glyoxylase-like metal-dependent hydrolase (beta-lactamase superfamily II)